MFTDNLENKIKDFKKYKYSVSAFLHVYLDLGFMYRNEQQIYKEVFSKCGVNKVSLDFCGYIAKELVRRKLLNYEKN